MAVDFICVHLRHLRFKLFAGMTPGKVLNTIVPDFTLNEADSSNAIKPSPTVTADLETSGPLMGLSVFSHGIDFWNNASRLRIDFNELTSAIQIEYIANSGTAVPGILDVYDSSGDQLAQYQTANLTTGQTEIMHLTGLSPSAAYAVATGTNGGFGRLTDLQVTEVPEPDATTLFFCGLGFAYRRLRRSR